MKYDARACQFNMGTGCVELLLRDGRKISINCTGVEDALDVTMAQRSELDYLIYNDPLAYPVPQRSLPPWMQRSLPTTWPASAAASETARVL